jgi:hypothetical protein
MIRQIARTGEKFKKSFIYTPILIAGVLSHRTTLFEITFYESETISQLVGKSQSVVLHQPFSGERGSDVY